MHQSLCVLAALLVVNAVHADDSDCRALADAISRSAAAGEQAAFKPGDCSLTDVTQRIAENFLATETDDFVLKPLEADTNTADIDSAVLDSVAFTPDESLLRVDWRLTSLASNGRRHVQWFSLQRAGWHWKVQQPIAPGTRIDASLVRRVYGELGVAERIDWLRWPADIQATAALAAGDTITAEDVSSVPELLAGDRAVLQVQRGAITMQLEGKLQEAAYLNETTRIKLHHSGAIVYGRLQANNIILPCDTGVLLDRNACAE